MYESPKMVRFGTIEELTRQGCFGAADGFSVPGIGNSTGTTPRVDPITGTTDICLVAS